jgi:hypothetical protein
MPDILATAEISNVDIEGTQFNSRIQGGILVDGLGSLISAFGTGLPMVSQAGNNGVIVLTGRASRRAGWCASGFLILMGMFGKFGAVFGSMVSLRRYSLPNPYPFWNFTDLNDNSHPPSSAECKYSSTAPLPSPESKSSGSSPGRDETGSS